MEEEMMDQVDKVKKIAEETVRDDRSLLYGASDEFIKEISAILPETEFGEFLDSYEEAQKIAKELMSGREKVDRKELNEKVIKIIRERADTDKVALKGLEDSLEKGTLADDFPSCKDFIDFVISAVEEDGGKVIEEKALQKDQLDTI